MDTNDKERIADCLAYIAANPGARYPHDWIAGVQAEARTAGLLPALKPVIGCNCKPGIDRGIVYGGDMEDAF